MLKKKVTTLGDTFKIFCDNSSLTGFKYMVDLKRGRFERFLWLIIHFIMFFITGYILMYAWYNLMDNPTVTTLETTAYPIKEVPFPGVAICNVNKISRKGAWKFVQFLANKTNEDVNDLFANVGLLGRLYDFDLDGKENFTFFQNILNNYDRYNKSQTYRADIRLLNLTTPCPDLLDKCHWMGREYKCSELFFSRRTNDGYCCVFNYLRKPSHQGPNREMRYVRRVYKTKIHGVKGGLSVIVNNDPDDYLYPVLSTIGVQVLIFNSKDYPDMTSGGVMQCLVAMGTETFMKITPTTVYAANEVKKYPLHKRRCLFDYESSTVFGTYTYSNCLMECKVKSILALCNCIPFMWPVDMNNSMCNLFDIPCLNKYKKKWWTSYPLGVENIPELLDDAEDSIACSKHCFTLCRKTSYSVNTNIAPLKLKEFGNNSTEKRTFVHVYFGEAGSNLFKQDVVYYWFEILSYYGGIFGLFIGLSLISVVEIIYFFTIHFINTLYI